MTDKVAESISLSQKVAFLSDPENYTESTSSVKTQKTHMSWVFLTDEYVYKLKKPFRYDHLKLLTPEARHQNCVEEVRLNKRLAKDVYLWVVPLYADEEGALMFREGSRVVDWMVKMKRLPDDMMLLHWIKSDKRVTTKQLKPVAELLSSFYNSAEPASVSVEKQIKTLNDNLGDYRMELLSPEFNLPEDLVNTVYEGQKEFIEMEEPIFRNRIKQGKIIEAHGDLKPEHLCLEPPVIIDCLEFDRNLRIMDVIADLAFLSVECDRFGVPWIGKYFIRHYIDKSEDIPPERLLNFYKSSKAYVRALLSIRHIKEEQYKYDPKWRDRTSHYLELAKKYIR